MKTLFKNILSGLIIGLTAFGVIYASLSSVQPGETLTSEKWNEVIGTMNTFSGALDGGLASPTGAVMAFNRDTCPSGWLRADGIESPLDLRGRFIRGLGGSENGQDEVRTLGSIQEDAFQNITGRTSQIVSASSNLGEQQQGAFFKTIGTVKRQPIIETDPNWDANYWNFDASKSPNARTANETRPKNIALIYCVKT